MLVTFAGILGPTWGGAVALAWLAAGALVLTGPGERAAATTVLRYRPAPRSWLAADVGAACAGDAGSTCTSHPRQPAGRRSAVGSSYQSGSGWP